MGLTYVINIEFQSINPDRAAQIANAVADGFIADQREAKYQAIRGATLWLQDRLNELRDQASAAEHAVVEYKAKNNIVDTGGRLIGEQRLTGIRLFLVDAFEDLAREIDLATNFDSSRTRRVHAARGPQFQRDSSNRPDIGGDLVAADAVSARGPANERAVLVGERQAQAIDLELGDIRDLL